MTDTNKVTQLGPGVVRTVFEDFISRLSKDPLIDSSVVEQLRVALVEQGESSADKLRKALFTEEVFQ